MHICFFCVDENEVWSDRENENEDFGGSQEESEEPPYLQESNIPDTSSSILVRWHLLFSSAPSQILFGRSCAGHPFCFLKAYFLILGRLYAPCAAIGQQLPSSAFMAKKMSQSRQGVLKGFLSVSIVVQCGRILKAMVEIKKLSCAQILIPWIVENVNVAEFF